MIISPTEYRTANQKVLQYIIALLILILPSSIIAATDLTATSQVPVFEFQKNDTVPNFKKRRLAVTAINIAGYGGSLIVLNSAWYKDYPRTSFHVFDDSREWLQVDKIGHGWTAYNTSRASTAMWRWAGLKPKKAAWIGSLSGVGYLTVIEFLDARSERWGWTWSDISANILGSAGFLSQELLWSEQRIQFKYSFHPREYNDPILNNRVNNLYGSSWYEKMLKDYNAQTYWLSFNLKSFWKNSNLPAWLNIAAGYGANGLYGGFENKWTDNNGNEINRNDIARKREFYLATDVDLTKIKTKSKAIRVGLAVLNSLKFPTPALMVNNKGKWKFYPLYF